MQPKITNLAELKACLASLDVMRERVRCLCVEFANWQKLPANDRPDPAHLQSAVSFAEIRDIDIRCRDAVAISSPKAAEMLSITNEQELAGPQEVATRLGKMRGILVHTISQIDPAFSGPESEAKEILILRPGIWGMGIDLKALWKKVRKRQ